MTKASDGKKLSPIYKPAVDGRLIIVSRPTRINPVLDFFYMRSDKK